MSSLKRKTIAGLKWSAIERVAFQGVSFIISIIIARILSPSDYGIVGMIAIFIGISNVFINAGFGAALIRKKDRSELDFSTVFFYNILAAVICYILLYISAPWIANFYETPLLIIVTRVVGLNIIIGAFGTLHRTKLVIAIDFKTQTKVTIVSLLITGGVGIFLAIKGFGVWALIFQRLSSTLVTTGLLWLFVRWKPLFRLSFKSFRELFGFGSKLMLSGLLDTIYRNIYQLVIGKMYSAADLGYYTRASGLAQLYPMEATSVLDRVTFPVLSEIQDDIKRLASTYRKLLKMSAFMVFPVMTILIALGEPIVEVLLTEKWMPAVPLMQMLCIGYMFTPIHAINLNLLKVKGRSDLFLRLEIIKKLMITMVLIISFSFGVFAICIGMAFVSIIALVINTHYTGKLINLGFWKQMKDIIPVFLLSVIAGIIAYLPVFLTVNLYVQLLLGGISGFVFFLGVAQLTRMSEMKEIMLLVRRKGLGSNNVESKINEDQSYE